MTDKPKCRAVFINSDGRRLVCKAADCDGARHAAAFFKDGRFDCGRCHVSFASAVDINEHDCDAMRAASDAAFRAWRRAHGVTREVEP